MFPAGIEEEGGKGWKREEEGGSYIVIIITICYTLYGPGSSVGIATGYGLDGLGIESRWRPDISHLFRPALGPTQPPVQWVTVLSPGVKCGPDVTLTPHPLLVPRSKTE
jgi:hypothetical protein